MNDARQELIRYRLDRAHETLEEAKILQEQGKNKGAMNRTYYAMFYAILALLASRGIASSKHTGVIAMFRREFVRTGLFPQDLAGNIDLAFDERMEADYADFTTLETDDLLTLVRNADLFIRKAEDLLQPLLS